MVTLTRPVGRFRIQIYDLETNKAKTITLYDGDESLDDIKAHIEECFNMNKFKK